MSVFVAAAEAAETNPLDLFLPPLGEVIISAFAVAIVAFILIKKALPTYLKFADERERRIREGLELTEQAKANQAAAEAKAAAVIDEAHAEATHMRGEARKDAHQIVEDAKAHASAEADRIIAASRRQLEAERLAAEASLREDVATLASQLADKIVGEHLQDEALSARVIDRFLADLERQPVAQEA